MKKAACAWNTGGWTIKHEKWPQSWRGHERNHTSEWKMTAHNYTSFAKCTDYVHASWCRLETRQLTKRYHMHDYIYKIIFLIEAILFWIKFYLSR